MEIINQCTAEFLNQPITAAFTIADRCLAAQESCNSEGIFSVYQLYYCTLEGNTNVFLPLVIGICLLCFYYLSYVADEHLGDVVHNLSDSFRMSESLAGVTLMAFEGGAPDVFASLSATSGGDPSGIQMGISVLLGSNLFTVAVLTGMCCLASPTDITVVKKYFIRDCVALVSTYVYLLYTIFIRQQIDISVSVTLIIAYFVYVCVVLTQDYH